MASEPQIEGTILTEGVGTGRGTRFASSAANQRLNTGGTERGVSGGKGGIDPSAARRLSAAGAQVRAQPLDALFLKPVITNGSGADARTINSVGDMLGASIVKYADRVSDAKADTAVLDFNEYTRRSFFGDEEKGDFGFSGLKGQAAVDARSSFFESIDAKMADMLAGMDPEVKQKALARMYSIRDTTLNRAASHIVSQQAELEQQIQYRKAEDLTRELVYDTSNAADLKVALGEVFGADSEGLDKHWDQAAITAANMRYNSVKARGGNGMEALKRYREDVKDTLTVKAQNALDQYIEAQQLDEEQAAKRLEAASIKQQAEQADASYARGLAAIEKNPTAFPDINSLIHLVPEAATDHTLLNMLVTHRDSYIKGDKVNEDVYGAESLLDEYEKKGTQFTSQFAMESTLREHGVELRPSTARALFKGHSKILSTDERTLKNSYMQAIKAIDTATSTFSVFDMMGEVGSTQATPELLKKTIGEQSQVKNYAQALKMKLGAVYHDQKLTPAQRHTEMTKILETEVGNAGKGTEGAAPQGMKDFPQEAFRNLGENFLIENYMSILKQQDNSPAPDKTGGWVEEELAGPVSNPDAAQGLPPVTDDEMAYLTQTLNWKPEERAIAYQIMRDGLPDATQHKFLRNAQIKQMPKGMKSYTGYAVLYPNGWEYNGRQMEPGWYPVAFEKKKKGKK